MYIFSYPNHELVGMSDWQLRVLVLKLTDKPLMPARLARGFWLTWISGILANVIPFETASWQQNGTPWTAFPETGDLTLAWRDTSDGQDCGERTEPKSFTHRGFTSHGVQRQPPRAWGTASGFVGLSTRAYPTTAVEAWKLSTSLGFLDINRRRCTPKPDPNY